MFFSYLFSGFIVLAPYMYFDKNLAICYSIVFSVITLFILGVVSARISKTSILRKGFVMMGVGGLAILIGILVSSFVNRF